MSSDVSPGAWLRSSRTLNARRSRSAFSMAGSCGSRYDHDIHLEARRTAFSAASMMMICRSTRRP